VLTNDIGKVPSRKTPHNTSFSVWWWLARSTPTTSMISSTALPPPTGRLRNGHCWCSGDVVFQDWSGAPSAFTSWCTGWWSCRWLLGAYYDGSCGGSLVYDQSLGNPHSVTGFIGSVGVVRIFYLTWHFD